MLANERINLSPTNRQPINEMDATLQSYTVPEMRVDL